MYKIILSLLILFNVTVLYADDNLIFNEGYDSYPTFDIDQSADLSDDDLDSQLYLPSYFNYKEREYKGGDIFNATVNLKEDEGSYVSIPVNFYTGNSGGRFTGASTFYRSASAAGQIPTFVNAYYNPKGDLKAVDVSMAGYTGVGAAVLAASFDSYDQYNANQHIDIYNALEEGMIVGGATFAGVVVGQATQKAVLDSSAYLFGVEQTAWTARFTSVVAGDIAGSSTAALLYAYGSYSAGRITPYEARLMAKKGVIGSIFLAGTKATGTKIWFTLMGSSGSASALGPYAITYFGAVSAMYLTDRMFSYMDEKEENDRLKALLESASK